MHLSLRKFKKKLHGNEWEMNEWNGAERSGLFMEWSGLPFRRPADNKRTVILSFLSFRILAPHWAERQVKPTGKTSAFPKLGLSVLPLFLYFFFYFEVCCLFRYCSRKRVGTVCVLKFRSALSKACLFQKRLPLSAVKEMVIFPIHCDRWCLYSACVGFCYINKRTVILSFLSFRILAPHWAETQAKSTGKTYASPKLGLSVFRSADRLLFIRHWNLYESRKLASHNSFRRQFLKWAIINLSLLWFRYKRERFETHLTSWKSCMLKKVS